MKASLNFRSSSSSRRARSGLGAALLAAVGIASFTPASAAADELDEDFAVWAAIAGTVELFPTAPSPAFWLDVQGRRDAGQSALLLRPGVGAQVLPWLSLWAGYAWTPTWPDPGQARVDEHRAWQQITLSGTVSGVALQSRTRVEQRFHEKGDDVGHRLRELVRVAWVPPGAPAGIVLWDEVFFALNDTDWGAADGYDQNRFFVGAVLPITPWLRAEAGYLLTHLNREPDRLVHTASMSLFATWRPSP